MDENEKEKRCLVSLKNVAMYNKIARINLVK